MLIRSLLFALSTLLYLNTRNHDYTFDDQYALINNPDILPSSDIYQIFHHDFWGQNLTSPMSNKSYRPLTVLSFRAQTWLASQLHNKNLILISTTITDQQIHHISNIIVHATNTALLYMVAIHLFSLLHSNTIRKVDDPHKNDHSTSIPHPHPRQQKQKHPWHYLHNHSHHQAFISAALFASHPIHTEAVASIVGHAELLSTFFLLTALLIHFSSIKRWLIGKNTTTNNNNNNNTIVQSRFRLMIRETASCTTILVLPTMLAWAAALCKETGITLLGALFIIDIYIMVYGSTSLFVVENRHNNDAKKRKTRESNAATTATVNNNEEGSISNEMATTDDIRVMVLLLIGIVVVYIMVGLGSYIALRRYISGGDHLVRIYRKVENPIPYAVDSLLTRWLTTAHLHTRYTWLMVVPFNLSADWSYACVEYVSSLVDARNVGTMVVYGVVVYIGVVSWKMLGLYDFLFNDEEDGKESDEESGSREGKGRRWWWSVAILIGLVVGPFLPASNIFFYVGTFIGERLLYIPSIGYCLLIASWMPTNYVGVRRDGMGEGKRTQNNKKKEKSSDDDSDSDNMFDNRSIAEQTGVPVFNAKTLYISIVTIVLILYSTKTVRRNRDWRDDATLFTSAALVCPASAKVQLNLGILHRRWGRYEAAIHHFQLAEQAEPSGQFCETKFQIAVTLLSNSLAAKVPIDSTMAFTLLEESLSCKYVAVEALKALNDVSLAVTRPGVDGVSLETRVGAAQKWAKTLCRPEISRYGDAVAVCEQASLLQATHSDTIKPFCLDLLNGVRQQVLTDYTTYINGLSSSSSQQQEQPSPLSVDWPLKQYPPLSTCTFNALYTCVAARHQLIQYAAAHKLEGAGISLEAKKIWYSYLNISRKVGCRQLPINTNNNMKKSDNMGIHPQLIHMAQSTDANDPWLQEEWGLILSHNKARLVEAYQHTSAAAYLLTQKLRHMLHAENNNNSNSEEGHQRGMLSLLRDGNEPLTSPREAMDGVERTTEMGVGIITKLMMMKKAVSGNGDDSASRHQEQEKMELQSAMCQLKKMECQGMEMMASLGPDEEKLHWEREALRCEEQEAEYCGGGRGEEEEAGGGNTLSDEL